jgi:hypothetical protein
MPFSTNATTYQTNHQQTPQLTEESIDVLGPAAPPHAFPTKYPPNCVDDPFPNKNGVFIFPPVAWKRRPAVSRAHQDPVVNMDELTTIFASKLHLREGVGKPRVRCHHRDSGIPWFAATVTILPPAPHPALLRHRKSGTNTSTTIPSPTVTRLQTQLAPSYSEPFSGAPSSLRLSYPTTHLLQRRPSNAGDNSEIKPTTQPRISSSRIPSFSSVGSRTSSWFSVAANDPITPPLLPTHEQGPAFTTEALGAFEEYIKTNNDDIGNAFTPTSIAYPNYNRSFSQTSFIHGFNSSFLPVAHCVAAQS